MKYVSIRLALRVNCEENRDAEREQRKCIGQVRFLIKESATPLCFSPRPLRINSKEVRTVAGTV